MAAGACEVAQRAAQRSLASFEMLKKVLQEGDASAHLGLLVYIDLKRVSRLPAYLRKRRISTVTQLGLDKLQAIIQGAKFAVDVLTG